LLVYEKIPSFADNGYVLGLFGLKQGHHTKLLAKSKRMERRGSSRVTTPITRTASRKGISFT